MIQIYENLFENLSSAVIILKNDDFSLVEMNRAAQFLIEAHDKPRSDTFKIDSLFPTSKKREGVVYLSPEHLKFENFYPEICLKTLQGLAVYVELAIKTIGDADGNSYLVLMFNDVTPHLKLRRELANKQDEITRSYEEILEQNKDLKKLDQMKDRFVALASHELRTPLSALVATSEVLKLKMYSSEQQMNEFIEIIYEQSQHLFMIVNDILDFSKIQAGRMEVYIGHQSPVKLLTSLTQQFGNAAKDKKVQITLKDLTNSTLCYFDVMRMRQVFSNIIMNAIKFTNEGTVIEIEIQQHQETILVSIKDGGPGISPENQSKIFNEFETLEAVSHHHEGTGLGLPISMKLTELQGGRISVESELGKGAKFIVHIPTQKILPEENYRNRAEEDEDDLI